MLRGQVYWGIGEAGLNHPRQLVRLPQDEASK